MRGEAVIEGTGWRLVYDMNALCAIEEQAGGRTIPEILAELPASEDEAAAKKVSFSTIRLLIWGGLQCHHEVPSLAAAGDIISEAGVQPCMRAMGVALTSSLGKADGKKDAVKNPRKAAAGTG